MKNNFLPTETRTIVLARTDMVSGNYRMEPRYRALVWLNEGTQDDVLKARAFAETEGYTVFQFETAESDPLGRARAIMRKDFLLEARRNGNLNTIAQAELDSDNEIYGREPRSCDEVNYE